MSARVAPSSSTAVAFGPYVLEPRQRLLTRNGEPVELGGRALDLLMVLIERANETVSKRELLAAVWPDVVVSEESLRFHMKTLRGALADGDDEARYITTQVGRGYCFVAPVRRHEPAPSISEVREPAPLATTPLRSSLPVRSRRMLGREQDSRLLLSHVLADRCVTVVGPGGVGKTTLAVAVAHDLESTFPGQVYFIDLSAFRNAALTSTALASVLGMSVPTDDPTPSVLAFLRTRRMLLVFDNCEHVIDDAARLIESIVHSAPEVHVIATSREALRIDGERIYPLEPLQAPPDSPELSAGTLMHYSAAQLFIDRANAGGWRHTPSDADARIIGRICRKLDGLALAIEFAAGRVATFGLGQTASLLDETLGLAWSGRRTARPRQQTLEATLSWSCALLPPIELRVLYRLSIFVGHFCLEVAQVVAADDEVDARSVIAAVEALHAKSLLSLSSYAGRTTYRLMETTRAYCMERLQADEREHHELALRHARLFQRLLEYPESCFKEDAQSWRSYLAENLSNVRAALEWAFSPRGHAPTAISLARVASRLFLELSLLTECRRWCERAIASMADSQRGDATEHELQAAYGLSVTFTLGNSDTARIAFERALAIATALHDARNQVRMLARLHIFHERLGDFAGSLAKARQAAQIAAELAQPEQRAVASSLLAVSFHLMGDQARARTESEAALALSAPSERWQTIDAGFDHRNRSLITLARTLWLQGLPDQARARAAAAVSEAAGLDHPVTHCIALIWAVSVDLWTGDLEQAERHIDEFIAEAEIHSLSPYLAVGMGIKGELAIRRGQAESGVPALRECLRRLHAVRYELLTTHLNLSLAEGLIAIQRSAEARELIDSTIAHNEASGELIALPELLRVKASLLDDGAAEETLRNALEHSRRQHSMSWELRSAMDLARLLAKQTRVGAAHEALAPVFAKFTEGFDTADLRAARLLLDQLSANVTRAEKR
ncbi:ATP-binding protein [Steroidobacter agaridevorans]|uniref:ATP-binding protein n=1 Tax=Steroidobacter agaridevorans TaxID=2695856 RepID=UPI00137A46BF|nr:winged helix-turn-helix domain-containing protein [Steroidobacter agaridevorans]